MDGDNAIQALAERVEAVLSAQPGARTYMVTFSAGIQDFGGGNIGIATNLSLPDGSWDFSYYTKDGFGNYVPNVPAPKAIHPNFQQVYWNPGQIALATIIYVKGVTGSATAPTALDAAAEGIDLPQVKPADEEEVTP